MSASGCLALFLPSLAGGGAERVFVELANEFAGQGRRVDLVLASARGPYLADVAQGVRVVDLGAQRILAALPGLVRYLRNERPAALLSGLDHANVVAVLARRLAGGTTRCVISMRSVPSDVYGRAATAGSRVLLSFMRIAYRFADAAVANSEAVARDHMRVLGLPGGGVHVIHNPLNLPWIERQSRESVDHPWFADGAPPVVLGVGSLAPLKDFATLMQAFAIVRSRRACRLAILGEGPERTRLEAAAARLDIAADVLLPGFLPNPFNWMRRAGVIVSSSLTEGCPNALMQALALGKPIVSTDVGGSPELLERGRWGRLVPAGSAEAMAAAIVESLAARAAPAPRERAADFSLERVAGEYLRVLVPGEQAA